MPRLVRRAPLSERIKSYLNPWDFLLWLSEEVNDEWGERLKEWSVVIGVAMNFVFMVARANGGRAASYAGDDVFGDYEGRRGSGWLSWFVSEPSRSRNTVRNKLTGFPFRLPVLSGSSLGSRFSTLYIPSTANATTGSSRPRSMSLQQHHPPTASVSTPHLYHLLPFAFFPTL